LSVASKWLQKEKCYDVNMISTTALGGIWLTRNEFAFNKQARCEMHSKENLEAIPKMEDYIQGLKNGERERDHLPWEGRPRLHASEQDRRWSRSWRRAAEGDDRGRVLQ
jgi:hypothetical protein